MITLTPRKANVNDPIEEKEKLLHILFNRLSERYPVGLIEWMDKYRPEASKEISELEDRANENFKSNGSIQELKGILRDYWSIYMKTIRDFKEFKRNDRLLYKGQNPQIASIRS